MKKGIIKPRPVGGALFMGTVVEFWKDLEQELWIK